MNKKAVINFLSTLPDYSTEAEDIANARKDARSYKWDADTLNSIITGIQLCYIRPSFLQDYINEFVED